MRQAAWQMDPQIQWTPGTELVPVRGGTGYQFRAEVCGNSWWTMPAWASGMYPGHRLQALGYGLNHPVGPKGTFPAEGRPWSLSPQVAYWMDPRNDGLKRRHEGLRGAVRRAMRRIRRRI